MEGKTDGQVRILVVDDDPGVRQVLDSMLRSAGYEVELACHGRQALEFLENRPFQVIITDLVMPEQEGIETIKQIRKEYPALKVIAMSGAFGGDYLRIAGYLGAHRTLAKPIRLETVLRLVDEALQEPAQ
jgi:DNA-binding NtrC family response regulator